MPIARWWSSRSSHGLDFAAVSRHFALPAPNTPNNPTQSSPGSREGHPGDTRSRPAIDTPHTPRVRGVRRLRELPPRFASKVVVDANGCWIWTSQVNERGYPYFWFENGPKRAHRLAYELLIGPIPRGLVLDHLCRVRHCVNPDHLEPVTNRENLIRGREARRV